MTSALAHSPDYGRRYDTDERDRYMSIICDRMTAGELYCDILESLSLDRVTVHRWRQQSEEHRSMYAQAREDQAHKLAELCIKEAYKSNPENAHAQRVIVDTLKWYTSKVAPKLYGDKLVVQHEVLDVKSMSTEDLRALAAGKSPKLLGKGS